MDDKGKGKEDEVVRRRGIESVGRRAGMAGAKVKGIHRVNMFSLGVLANVKNILVLLTHPET